MKRAITQIFTLLLLITLAVPAFAGRVLAEIEYFYSDDGTLTGKAFNGKRVNFEYDLRGQLLAVKDAQGKDLERYTYDPAGNRLSKTINGLTTTYTYDKANQLVTSTVNGKTTHYKYDAAGRMIQAGDKKYIYNGQNKVSEVRQNGKTIAKFEYNIDGQIAKAIYGNKVEEFMWDGLALIWRSGVTYINEPYVTGGNPVMAGDDVLFNDMLGSTLAVNGKAVEMTSFGETGDKNAFFTGKPMIDELGYSFLFRDYNPNQGKWTTTDPLGYPDGWNNLAYCNNGINQIDILGLAGSADTFAVICIGLYILPFKNITQVEDYGVKKLECYQIGGQYLSSDSEIQSNLAPIETELKKMIEQSDSPVVIKRSVTKRWSNTFTWQTVLDTGTININAVGSFYQVENNIKEYKLTINYEFFDELDFRGINHGEFPGWNQINSIYDAGGTFGALGETLLDWILDGAFGMNYYVKSTWSKTIKWRLE